MESYTFNSSKSKRFRGKFLILYNKYLMMWSGIFIYLAKAYRNRSKKAFNSGRSLVEESEGISFRIQKAILMDRNVMRLLIITTDPNSKAEKKKYFPDLFPDDLEGTSEANEIKKEQRRMRQELLDDMF